MNVATIVPTCTVQVPTLVEDVLGFAVTVAVKLVPLEARVHVSQDVLFDVTDHVAWLVTETVDDCGCDDGAHEVGDIWR